MKARVRYVSSVPALCFDPQHGRMVKVVRKVDTKGREWEEWSVFSDGEQATAYSIPIEAPEEPATKRSRKVDRKAK